MAEKNRVEGQLWIDRKEPHGLKYHTDGETYQLTPEKVYGVIVPANTTIPKGALVAINGVDSFKLAQFPRDIDKVIGICPIELKNNTSSEKTIETSILRNGNITLTKDFFKQENSDISNWNNMVGAPVYWFIGRTYKNGSSYSYIDPGFKNIEGASDNFDNRGKLTLATPSGMRWDTSTSCNDNSLNVGYSNLPIVGTVVAVSGDNVTINVNISKFESSLEWNWPYYSEADNAPLASSTPSNKASDVCFGNMEIPIRHGLFPSIMTNGTENYYNFRPRCFCDVTVLEGGNNDTEHKALAGVDNYYGLPEGESADNDKRTEILIKSNIPLASKKRINVSGKVVYTFVKQYE